MMFVLRGRRLSIGIGGGARLGGGTVLWVVVLVESGPAIEEDVGVATSSFLPGPEDRCPGFCCVATQENLQLGFPTMDT